jgi:hypothetical protein
MVYPAPHYYFYSPVYYSYAHFILVQFDGLVADRIPVCGLLQL